MNRKRMAVTALLAGLGALGGAAAAVAMNIASSIAAGEPGIPGYVVYHFKVMPMAILGGITAPTVAWSMLRATPIWRAVVEPSGAVLAAGALAIVAAPSAYMLALPAAAILASWHLSRRYPQQPPELPQAEVQSIARAQ